MDQLKKAIFSAKDDQLTQTKQVIDMLYQTKLIDQAKYQEYELQWNEIKEKVEGNLENMGFDMAQKVEQMNKLKMALGSFGLIVVHGVAQIGPLVKKVVDAVKGRDRVEQANLLKNVKQSFNEYIKTCLNTCDNQITIQLARQDQLINIIGLQKQLKEQTLGEAQEESYQQDHEYTINTFNQRFRKC